MNYIAERTAMIRVPRHVVVVEILTSGPDPRRHQIIEIAGVDVVTGARVAGRWALTDAEVARADPDYLDAVDYAARPEAGGAARPDVAEALADMLSGNTLGAIDPVWVAAFTVRFFTQYNCSPGWHSRFADLAALAAGAHGMAATALPNLAATCALLGIQAPNSCSALDAANAAASCFRELHEPARPSGRHLRAVPEIS